VQLDLPVDVGGSIKRPIQQLIVFSHPKDSIFEITVNQKVSRITSCDPHMLYRAKIFEELPE